MGKYYGNDGNFYLTDLLKHHWSLMTEQEYIDTYGLSEEISDFYEKIHDNHMAIVSIKESLTEIVPKGSPDSHFNRNKNKEFLYVVFSYSKSDMLHLCPIAISIRYPYSDNNEEWEGEYKDILLNVNESEYFSGLLKELIGDNHPKEMQKIMTEYHNSVDPDTFNFVQDVQNDRDVLPITVGFVSSDMGNKIKELTGLETTGNRIVISDDDIRHILKRHGKNGVADHSLAYADDIARIGYVIENYDSITWSGKTSNFHCLTKDGKPAPQIVISKVIGDMRYVVVQIATDGKKRRNYVITAYLQKIKK